MEHIIAIILGGAIGTLYRYLELECKSEAPVDLLKKATEPFNYHDGCHACGERKDGLALCSWIDVTGITQLCPDCVEEHNFCKGCGIHRGDDPKPQVEKDDGYCSICLDIIDSYLK